MAIYLNDRILKADQKGSAIEREYFEGLKKVEELFKRFRRKGETTSYVQIARNIKDSERVFSNRGKQKKLPPIALPVEIPYYDEEMGATSIRYSTNPPMVNSNGGHNWPTKWIEFNEVMTITDKQKDLAWFLLFASNLIKKGIYQLVDVQAKYEGTFNEIMVKKEVMDFLTSGDDELVNLIATTFVNESFVHLEPVEKVVKVNNWVEANNKWEPVLAEIRKYNSSAILEKSRVTSIEWEGQEVEMQKCPADVNNRDLKAEAQSLGIRLTVPPQTKDVLYSLVQHIKSKK